MEHASMEETEQIVATMLAAVERHGEETGHDVTSFSMPSDRIQPKCNVCGAIIFEGPPLICDDDLADA